MLSLIGTGIGSALSYWGEKNRQVEEERAIEAQRKALKEAKYTSGEKANILDKVGDQYNTSNLNIMNASALGLSGVLNSDTLRGLTASRLLGERANKLSETELSILDANKKIDTQIAGLGSASPVNIGNIIGGGLAGFQAGEALDKSGVFKNLFGDSNAKVGADAITTATNPNPPSLTGNELAKYQEQKKLWQGWI